MPITPRLIRWSCFAAVASSIAMVGCGGGEAPTGNSAIVLPTGNNSSGTNDHVEVFAPAPEFPTASTQAASQRARMQAQEIPTPTGTSAGESVAQVRDDVQQTSNSVSQGADDLKAGVTQAVGEAQTQARQAASSAADNAKGFAAELRDDATQSLNSAVSQAKASAQGAADGAKQQVQTAVDGAKDNVRRRARAAANSATKQAQDAGDKVLNNLLGPAPKN